MAEKKTYVVTKRAGRRVAGIIVVVGSELDLTADEAAHHLAAGEIVEKGSALDSAFGASATAARLRDEAKAFRARAVAPASAPEHLPAASAEAEPATPTKPVASARTAEKKG